MAAHLAHARTRLNAERAKLRGERTAAHDLVYFIQCERFVKIGRAYDVDARLRNLQKHTPFDLTLLAIEEGGETREAELHGRFRPLQHRGEWFRHEGALAAYICDLRDQKSRRKSQHRGISDAQWDENIRLISGLEGSGAK